MAVKPQPGQGGMMELGCLETTPEPDENVTFSRTGEDCYFLLWPSLKTPGEVNPSLLLRCFPKDLLFSEFSGLFYTTN